MMKIKGLTILELDKGNPLFGMKWNKARKLINDALILSQFMPCPETVPLSQGFFHIHSDSFVWSIAGDCGVICLATEKRLVSKAALRLEVDEKAKEQHSSGVLVTAACRQKLKEICLLEDLKKAQKVRTYLTAIVDGRNKMVYVNSAKEKEVDDLIHWLVKAFQTFKVHRQTFIREPSSVMSIWLRAIDGNTGLPDKLRFDGLDQMERTHGDGDTERVKFSDVADMDEDLQGCLSRGFGITKLRLVLEDDENSDGIRFTLHENGALSGIHCDYLSAEHEAAEDEFSRFEADVLLSIGICRIFLGKFREWFGNNE